MLRLVITEKGGETKHLEFEKDEISIGRVQGNDIVLPKGNISKRHSKLTFRDGRYSVSDLKSTNGTYVNGRKIADATPVTAADKIYVGDFVITLADAEEEEVLASAPPRRSAVPPPPPPPRAQTKAPAAPARPVKGPLDEEEDDAIDIGPPPARPGRPGAPPPPPARRDALDLGGDDDEAPPSPDEALPPPPDDVGLMEDEPLASAPPRRPTGPARSLSLDDEEDVADQPPPPPRPRPAPPTAAPPARARPAQAPAASAAPAPVGSLQELLEDDAVTAIFITGPDSVHVERGGRVEAAALSLGDADALTDTIRQMAAMCTPPPAEDAVAIDTRLPEGGRLSAVLPPLAPGGACAAIRKVGRGSRSLGDLVAAGGASKEIQQLLEACVGARRNVLVSGDGPAAIAVLGAIAGAFSSQSRVVSVSDRGEIALPIEGWVSLVSSPDHPGVVRAAAALRPDYLVAPDLGPSSAADLLIAAAGGQEGVFAGIGARSAGEALARLEALAAVGLHGGVKELTLSTFDLVVHAATGPDGSVRVLDVADIKTGTDGKLAADPVIAWKGDGAGTGGRHVPSGVTPRVAAALSVRGAPLPAGLFRR